MRSLWLARLLVVVGGGLAFLVGAAGPASAHPLGNFTTNRYARVEVGASVIRVHYVLDEAELVAFRARAALAGDVDAYGERRVGEIAAGLRLEVDGAPLALRPVVHALTQPAGQGGLTTLRIDAVFEADLPDGLGGGRTPASFSDGNQPDRIGWREVVVRATAGADIVESNVPETDRTDGLRNYPTDPGVAPLDVRSATFRFVPGTGTDGIASLAAEDDAKGSARTGDRFVRLLANTTSSPLAIAGALAVAFAFGAVHAVGPGHGKTVMAAYLVSTEGRRRDAVALGAVVSLMHTISVLALAGLLATIAKDVRAERIYPALTLVAGVLVVGVGANLLRRRLAARRRPTSEHHDHDHDRVLDEHDHGRVDVALPAATGATATALDDHKGNTNEHTHDHHDEHDEHEHEHGPEHEPEHGHHVHGPGTHTHELDEGVRPLSRAGILALGTSGGLFPSPSAVVVLVGAFALGRAALGLALILAFSVGLAVVLVTVGLLLVAGRDRLRSSRLALSLPWLPILGAAAITVLGLVLLVQGFTQLT